MKKLISLLIVAVMTFATFSVAIPVGAAPSGTCGENLTWELNTETGVFTISGTGEMQNYSYGNSPWYNYRANIRSVIINYGPTSIGDYAFLYHTNLTSIIIPDSVKSIGSCSISNCSSLASITIPDSVTSIGFAAFSYCSSLTSVTLPDGRGTAIGSNAFSYCTRLTSITIPNSVTSIENDVFAHCNRLNYNAFDNAKYLGNATNPYFALIEATSKEITSCNIYEGTQIIASLAFGDCSNLTSVSIPDSVTTIGSGAFSGCSKLSSITIPDNVTLIEDNTFKNCTTLARVTIPDKVISIGSFAFQHCSLLIIVTIPNSVSSIMSYAFDDCASLTDIYYYGTEETWSRINIRNKNDSLMSATIHYLPNVVKNISELNSISSALAVNGKLHNATVYSSVTLKKLADVAVNYNGSVLSFSKVGYYTVAIPTPTLTDYSKLALVPESTGSGVSAVHCNGVDALINSVEAVRENQEMLNINVYAPGATAYKITANDSIIATNNTGTFSINSATITQDVPLYVEARLSDGKWGKPLKTNIKSISEVRIDVKTNAFSFDIPIPDNIWFFGGKKLKISLDSFPIGININPIDKTFKLAIGVDVDKTSESFGFKWADFGKAVTDMSRLANDKNGLKKAANKFFKKEQKEYLKKGKVGGFDLDFCLAGYAEGTYDPNGVTYVKGNIVVSVEGEYGMEYQWVGAPVVLKLKISAGVASVLGISVDESNSVTVSYPSIQFTLPKVYLSGGVGLKYVGDISAYGEITNTLNLEKYLTTATLSGEAGFSAKFLFFSTKMKLWEGSTEYYRKVKNTTRNGLTNFLSMPKRDLVCEYIENPDNYTINYPSNTSEWFGDKGTMPEEKFFYSNGDGVLPNEEDYAVNSKTLQSGIYTAASPEIVEAGGQQMMVWTASDSSRAVGNHTVAVYSIYDADSDTWSAPQAVADDGTADFYPHAATDGTDVYVVWSNSKVALDDTYTMETVAPELEIAAAKYDFATGSFENAVTVTNNSTIDLIQDVYVNDGEADFVWINNSSNDAFLEEGTNTIMKGSFDGETLSSSAVKAENEIIYSVACADVSGTAVAYVTPSANEETAEGIIHLIESDGREAELSDAVGLAPKFAGETLVWYSNGALVDVNGNTLIEADGKFSSKYEIVEGYGSTAVITIAPDTESDEEGTDIYAYINEDGEYSGAVRVTETAGYTTSLSGIYDGDDLVLVYGRTEYTSDDGSDTFEEVCDLCVSTVGAMHKIAIADVDYDEAALVPGEDFPIELTVKNSGNCTENELVINVYDNDGNLYHTETAECAILPGTEETLTFMLPVNDFIAMAEDYTVSVGFADGEDACEAVEFTIGHSDISLDADIIKAENAAGIIANVDNISSIGTNAVLRIYKGSEEGELLKEYSIGYLEPGESYPFYIEAEALAEFAEKGDSLYIEVECENREAAIGDNNAILVYDYDEEAETLPGDADGDGKINAKDITLIKRFISGLADEDDVILENCDMNGDGKINVKDINLIKKFIAGVE